MNNFIKVSWKVACIVLAVIYLFSCFSQFIPARTFSYAVFFALLFPYLFVAIVIMAVINVFVNKKWGFAFYLLMIPGLYNFFHVVAITPGTFWKMEKETGAARIMTWNVSDFIDPSPLDSPLGAKRKAILNTISEFKPDFLCIQEYYNVDSCRELGSAKHELDSLGYKYINFSNDQTDRAFWGIMERGVAIFSKTPFLDSVRLQIRHDYHPEYLVYADVMLQDQPVRVVTAHLASFYLFPDSAKGYAGKRNVAKKLYTYKHDVEEKLRDIEILHDEQAAFINNLLDTSSIPVIYCGDINATAAMYSYRLLKGNRQDAFLKKGNGIGATFYNIVPTLRIDMIFPDRRLQVLQCKVPERNLGDHNPVVTDVKWR